LYFSDVSLWVGLFYTKYLKFCLNPISKGVCLYFLWKWSKHWFYVEVISSDGMWMSRIIHFWKLLANILPFSTDSDKQTWRMLEFYPNITWFCSGEYSLLKRMVKNIRRRSNISNYCGVQQEKRELLSEWNNGDVMFFLI
jgi:hypothetical protein